MAHNFFALKPIWDERVVEEIITIWDRWHPSCDFCGCLESSLLKERLMSCSYCRVAKYCSDKCQKYDWSDGSRHKERCHLFEVDRKLSDEYIKFIESSGRGVTNPTVSLEEKVSLWTGLHRNNIRLIQSAVFKHKKSMEKTPHLGIFLRFSGHGPEYDHRSFVIEKVALIPWSPREAWSNVMVGFCLLPGGKMFSLEPEPDYCYSASGTPLPPSFDLHRYITHINREITHFHGSFWPLPRRLSDAAFEAAEAPKDWLRYMRLNCNGFQYVTSITSAVFGVAKGDGRQAPLYKYDKHVYEVAFDWRLEALAKVDTTEFKKLLDDPSRKVCLVPRPDIEAVSEKSKSNSS